MVYPTLLLNVYAHPVRKSILKEYGLPHTVVEWYVRRKHESLLKEYGLPYTVVEWYIRCKHKCLLKEYGCCCTYPANTKFYEVLYTWQ